MDALVRAIELALSVSRLSPRDPAPVGEPPVSDAAEAQPAEVPTELSHLNDEELTRALRDAKQDLFELRFENATGQLTDSLGLTTIRRHLARIYAEMRERELRTTEARRERDRL
jgi:large subunit ribosomal protein L29